MVGNESLFKLAGIPSRAEKRLLGLLERSRRFQEFCLARYTGTLGWFELLERDRELDLYLLKLFSQFANLEDSHFSVTTIRNLQYHHGHIGKDPGLLFEQRGRGILTVTAGRKTKKSQ